MYLSFAKALVQIEELILKYHQSRSMGVHNAFEEKSDDLKSLEEHRDYIVLQISRLYQGGKHDRL